MSGTDATITAHGSTVRITPDQVHIDAEGNAFPFEVTATRSDAGIPTVLIDSGLFPPESAPDGYPVDPAASVPALRVLVNDWLMVTTGENLSTPGADLSAIVAALFPTGDWSFLLIQCDCGYSTPAGSKQDVYETYYGLGGHQETQGCTRMREFQLTAMETTVTRSG